MKIILFSVSLLYVFISGCAELEPAANSSQPIVFTYSYPSKTKDQIFSSSRSWIAETFVSGKSVIDDADRESGRIVAKGRIKRKCQGVDCLAHGGEYFGFTMRIDTKDGKFKMTFLDTTVYAPEGPDRGIYTKGDMEAAKAAFEDLSFSLKSYLIKESSDNDW